MKGTRYPDNTFPQSEGGFSKSLTKDGKFYCWIVWPPGAKGLCIIGKSNADGSPFHWVQEHDDGMITVQPNPPDAPEDRRNSNSILFGGFHGYIYHGEWKSC